MSYSLNAPRKFPLEDFWKVKIVPPSAGVDALVVRDYADTVSRIKIMEGDKGIWGYDAAGTWMFRLMPYDAYDAITFNTGVDFRDKMLLSGPYFTLANGKSIRTEGTATSSFLLRSHDGAAYVDCAKLVGGFLEIAKGKLTGDLIPDTDQTRNLGNSTLAFKNAWFTEWWSTAGAVFIRKYLRTQEIRPITDKFFNLGVGDARWKSIFFGENLIADSDSADDVTTLVDSPLVTLRGSYWDSANLVAVDIDGAIKLHVDGEGSAHIEFDRKLEFPGGTLTGGLAPDTDLNRVLGSGTRHFYEIYTRAVRRTGGFLELRSSHGVYCYLASNYAFAPGADNSNDLGSGSYRWRKLVLGTECHLLCNPATSSVTTQDSPVLRLRGAYWDGATSVGRDASIFHRILSTAPTSELVFQFAGSTKLTLKDTGELVATNQLKREATGTILIVKIPGETYSRFRMTDTSLEYSEGVSAVHDVLRADRATTTNVYLECFGAGSLCLGTQNQGTRVSIKYDSLKLESGVDFNVNQNDIYNVKSITSYTLSPQTTFIICQPSDASATYPTRDSLKIVFRGKYWDGATSVNRDFGLFHRILSTTPESAIDFEIAGTLCARIKDNGALAIKKVDIGDYGGNFATYSPPTGEEGMIVIAVDTNATAPGQRLYVYCNGSWRYANLT